MRDNGTGANRNAPAVQTDSTRHNTSAPVPGANSFTESQARSRIEGAGFANVTGLHKDDQGVWRGRGTRSGAAADVSLDFQGNVTGR
jgi:putative membrane protein